MIMSKKTHLKETYPRSASSRDDMQAPKASFFSKFVTKMKISLTPRKIIVKKGDDWDDDDDEYDYPEDEEAHYNNSDNNDIYRNKNHPHDDEEDDTLYSDNSSAPHKKRKSIIILMIIAIILVVLAFVTYYLIKNSFNNEGRSLPLKTAEKTEEYPVGARKLERPLFGDTGEEMDDAALPNQQKEKAPSPTDSIPFDFSPLESKSIEQMPVLPQKKVKENQYQPFEDLWSDPNAKTPPNLPSEEDYKKMNINQLQNESLRFLPPWKRYAARSEPTGKDVPIYAIVLNYDPKILPIEDLPPYRLTLAIEGYAPNAQELTDTLRAKGYEVILELPMAEPKENAVNPGVKPIEKGMSFDEMRNRIAWHIQNVTGHIGFKNRFGTAVLGSTAEMNFTMNLLSDAGYSFLEAVDKTANINSVAYAYAKATNMPTRQTDAIIEVIAEEFPIFLKKVSKVKTGVAIINATPDNIVYLNKTLSKLNNYNIKLVPLSHIYVSDDVIKRNGM